MKRLLLSLVLLVTLAAGVNAGEWLYVDVIVCEDPPDAIRWKAFAVEIAVWDKANPGGLVLDWWNPSLGGELYYVDHYLPGFIDSWSAWIFPGKVRLHPQGSPYYQVRWASVSAYDNDASNYSTLHLDFEFRVDPNQNAITPDTPLRTKQWQEAW